ncbi:MAG: hypothetical protein RSB95_05420 [Bacilli bacterium]
MAKSKLGIGQIEVNKKFASRDEAFRYAKNLREHIRYICNKNKNKGWQCQVMISISNLNKGVSGLSTFF